MKLNNAENKAAFTSWPLGAVIGSAMCVRAFDAAFAEQKRVGVVRLAKLEIDPDQVESYKATLREESESSKVRQLWSDDA
jgi:hypothetical protein